jgi:hypothetical protein
MKKFVSNFIPLVLFLVACESETIEQPESEQSTFSIHMAANFEGQDMEQYVYYENIQGDEMNFEQVRVYLSDIYLIHSSGDSTMVSEVEYFDLTDGPKEFTFEMTPGDYDGLVYHVGVPQRLNGMDNPDFTTSIYDAESPLNVQNGMYWAWATGYRFAIYEGRLDTTPDISGDVPAFYSLHLGKDSLYTRIEVNQDFSIPSSGDRQFNIDWDLSRCIYDETDTLNLRDPLESQFHGEDMTLGRRFRQFMSKSFSHSFE